MKYWFSVALIIISVSIYAQPANNNLASATALTLNTCSANGAYTTVAATSDLNPGSCWNTTGGTNVWFSFVATTTQVNVQLFTGGTEGTIQYPYLALWQSDGTTQLRCNTYNSQYHDLELNSVSLTIGNTYYISVDNHNGSSGYRGTFKLCINDAANYDFYEGATDVSGLINSCSADAAYSTNGASSDKNAGSCWNTAGGNNRWFKFTATTTQIKVEVKTGGSEGTIQYGYAALWDTNGTTQLACVNYSSQYSDLNLNAVGLTIGNTYYVSVDNHNGSAGYRGTFKLCLTDAVDYDFYEGAVDVSGLMNSCSADGAYTTIQATDDKNPASCWNTTGGANRWFKFTATTSQIKVEVRTGGSEGTIQYPYVALWQSNGTTQLACINYTSQYSDLTMSAIGLTAGNTYYISVDNNNGSTGYRGTFKLCLTDAVDYDFYEGATDVSALINSCSADAAYTTSQATNDLGSASCWNTTGGSNRWFKFTATTSQIKVEVRTGGSEGTLQYGYVALWQSNGTTQLGCINYSSQYSDLTMNAIGLTVGNTYYISVDNNNGSTGYRGTFKLCLTDAVDYDYYEGAVDVSGLMNTCSADGAYTTVQATNDKSPGSCWNTTAGSNRWFKFTATTTQVKVDVLTGGSEGTIQYPYVALWQADGTTQLACINYSSQYSDLTMGALNLTPGNTYYISVDNNNGSTGYRGTFKLCLSDAVDYDFYEGAINVSSLINSCSADAAYTTTQATSDKSPGSCWNTTGGSNRWFKFVATTTQIKVEVKTGSSEGTLQYPYVALWQSNGTTQISCINYTSQYSDLTMSAIGLTIGNTYYISVDNNNGSTGYRGTFKLCLTDAADYDYYDAAITLSDINNWCSSNAAYTTSQATSDKSPGSCWNTTGGSNRWFKFVATTNFVNIDVKTGGTEGTLQYPYVALWAADGTTQLACQQYSSQYSDLDLNYASLTPGNTYYISVDNNNGSTGYRGTFSLCVNEQVDYDFYEGANELTDLNNWCSANAAYSTLNATKDKNNASCWNTVGGSNRWFKFVAVTSNVTIQLLTGGAEGTVQYPYLALWASNGTTQLACANYTSQYSDLSITYNMLVPGTTYYIAVDNHNGSTGYRGSFKLCINNINTVYYSRADGAWNDTNTWSTIGYGGAAASSYPNGGDVVNIQGNLISVAGTQQAAEVNLNAATNTTSLALSSATLTVNGKVTMTNVGNNVPLLLSLISSTMYINDNFTLTRSGGNQNFDITVGTGCSMTVNKDLSWTSSAGTAFDNNLVVNGTGAVSVNQDVLLNSSGGRLIKLQFNSSSVFTVGRDITFTATAAGQELIELNNSATLKYGRDIVRGATPYGALTCNNTSTVELNGNTYLQTLAGSAGSGGDSFSYMNVNFNNTRITTPQITLGGAVTVNGTMTMNNGVVSTTATNILNLLNASATTIGNSNCYIDGPMTYEVATNVANTVRNFPVGNNGSYRPAVLTVNHTDNSSAIYTVQHYMTSAATLGYTLAATTERVSGVRYWSINRSGAANLTNARVRLYYGIGTTDGVTDYTNLTVVKNVGAGTTWVDIGGTASGNGSGNILSGTFTSFSNFTLANLSTGTNPLPVEWLGFDADVQNDGVLLRWKTAMEKDNDHFSIERSHNGKDFITQGRVPAAGTTQQVQQYSYKDTRPVSGLSYYRLKQTDLNGGFTYSNVISVNIRQEIPFTVQFYPNPSKQRNLFIKVQGVFRQELHITMQDALGNIVLEQHVTPDDNGEGILVLRPSLAPGLYFITTKTPQRSLVSKQFVE